jgi:hypothetical protein
MGVALDGESLVPEECPAFGQAGVGQVDQDADALVPAGAESGLQQAPEAEWGKVRLIHGKVTLGSGRRRADRQRYLSRKIKPKNRLARRVEGG